LNKKDAVDHAIEQMTSVDKFIACLMMANRICFWGKTPRFYKNEQTIRNMCPPKAKQLFNLKNLKRLGIVYPVPKSADLVALEGFGIRVAKKLYETGEAKKVYDLYGAQYVPI
jgi:hypothetical protein